MSAKSLLDDFSALEDRRRDWKAVHPLPEILLIVLCGTMAGVEDFVEIGRRPTKKLELSRE